MREAGIGGSIIFVTSILGTERGLFPGTAVSGASIAAVNYLTRVKFSLSLFLTHVYKCMYAYVRMIVCMCVYVENKIQLF